MGRTLTNNFQLACAREQSFGVLPGSPSWLVLEPNSLDRAGSEITKVVRQPISQSRQRRKGAPVRLESMVGWESDLTMEHFVEFIEGFMFASFGTTPRSYVPTAVTSTGYTVAANGDLPDNTLIFARGFLTSGNNGLKVTAGSSTTTEIKAAGLTAETIPGDGSRNATVEVAGRRGASADITMTAQGNLASTLLDFTTLGLTVGQWIKIGGTAAANQFATAANNGTARIKIIAANLLTLEWRSGTFVSDTGTGKQIDLYFGKFVKNVSVNDAAFLERSYTFELAFDNLGAAGADAYEYPTGNYCNEISFALPLNDKSTIRYSFVGKDTPNPTETRATNAATPRRQVRTAVMTSTNDIARLGLSKTDETSLSTDFKSLNLTVRNNVAGEDVIGNFGAKYMNYGLFEVDIDASVIFTTADVPTAIRNNQTLALVFGMNNEDGGFIVDMPALTIEGGGKQFPINQSILLSLPARTFQDPTLGWTLSVSHFPYYPE